MLVLIARVLRQCVRIVNRAFFMVVVYAFGTHHFQLILMGRLGNVYKGKRRMYIGLFFFQRRVWIKFCSPKNCIAKVVMLLANLQIAIAYCKCGLLAAFSRCRDERLRYCTTVQKSAQHNLRMFEGSVIFDAAHLMDGRTLNIASSLIPHSGNFFLHIEEHSLRLGKFLSQ